MGRKEFYSDLRHHGKSFERTRLVLAWGDKLMADEAGKHLSVMWHINEVIHNVRKETSWAAGQRLCVLWPPAFVGRSP